MKAPEEQTQAAGAASKGAKKAVIELDETIDVEAFFKQDCDGAAQVSVHHVKKPCALDMNTSRADYGI